MVRLENILDVDAHFLMFAGRDRPGRGGARAAEGVGDSDRLLRMRTVDPELSLASGRY